LAVVSLVVLAWMAVVWQRGLLDTFLASRRSSSTPPSSAPRPVSDESVQPSQVVQSIVEPNRASEASGDAATSAVPLGDDVPQSELSRSLPPKPNGDEQPLAVQSPAGTALEASSGATTEPARVAVLDAAALRQVAQQLRAARTAAIQRNWGDARQQIDLADATLAAADPAIEELVALRSAARRLAELITHAEEYWRAVDQGWTRLQPAAELMLDRGPAAVVEIAPDFIVVRAEGENHRWLRSALPGQVARAIAATWLDPQRDTNLLLQAAFETLERNFEGEELERLWMEVKRAGIAVGDLPQVLSDNPEELVERAIAARDEPLTTNEGAASGSDATD
jgi:hypothetical protein